jgi:hypothetical protein
MDHMAKEYLTYYMIQVKHPEIFTNDFFQKLNSFHGERERLKYLEIAIPEISRNYELKTIISNMGKFQLNQKMPIDAQVEVIEATLR